MRLDDHARKIVVVPDAHAAPAYDAERFSWLGAFIERERPSHVVCLGDFADLPSLSQYDKGKRGFEGRRYTKDVEATREALRSLHAEVRHASPRWLMCLGNHEARITRATNDAAELDGAIGIDDLGYREHGWECLPYQAVLTVGGVNFSHHFASGVSGRPIGGLHQAAAMIRLLHASSVVGHSHVYDMSVQTRPDGSRVFALVAGCYVHADHHEGWSSATEHMWVNGVTVLEDVRDGWPQAWRFVSQQTLRDAYAKPQSDAGSVHLGPPSVSTGHAPQLDTAVSIAGIDYDDGYESTAIDVEQRISWSEAARICGRDESTVRKSGLSAAAYVRRWLEGRAT